MIIEGSPLYSARGLLNKVKLHEMKRENREKEDFGTEWLPRLSLFIIDKYEDTK